MENSRPAAIVHIYHPDITPEERARRLEQIRKAAADLIIATERNKRAKERQTEYGGTSKIRNDGGNR